MKETRSSILANQEAQLSVAIAGRAPSLMGESEVEDDSASAVTVVNKTNIDASGSVLPDEPKIIQSSMVDGVAMADIAAPSFPDAKASAVTISAYAITLVAGLNSGWFGPLLPSIAQGHHIPLEKAGILASAVCAGCLCSLAASKQIMTRLEDLKTTLLAAGLAALGFIGLGTMGGLLPLAACAFCYGMGVGLNGIASHILFPRYYPTKVASALSKLNVFFGIGALLGPLLALALLGLKVPYNWIFIGTGILVLAICANLIRVDRLEVGKTELPAKPALPTQTVEKTALKSIIFHPLLMGITAINFIYVGVETTLGTWLYTFLQRAESLPSDLAFTAVSLLWAGLTLGRIASARACLHVKPKYVTMTAMLFLVGTIFAAALIHMGAGLALPMVLLIGLGLGPIFPTIIAQSATKFPSTSSITTTIVIAAGYVGGMLLPWLGGNALVRYGAANFMLLSGAVALILPILLTLTLFPIWHRRRHQ